MARSLVVAIAILITSTSVADEITSGKLMLLLQLPAVQKELELTREQKASISKLQSASLEFSRALKSDQMESLPPDQQAELLKTLAAGFGAFDADATQLLDAGQRTRLHQLYSQLVTQRDRSNFRLLSELAVEHLQITAAQQTAIAERLAVQQAALAKKRAAVLSTILAAHRAIFELLSPAQREQYTALCGPLFPSIWEEAALAGVDSKLLVTQTLRGMQSNRDLDLEDLFRLSDGSVLLLLALRPVAEELSLSEAQTRALDDVRRQRGMAVIQFRQASRGPRGATAGPFLPDAMKQIETEHDRLALSELTDRQLHRFRQIYIQFQTRHEPFSFGLSTAAIASHVHLTDSQRAAIQQTAEKFRETFRSAVEQLEKEWLEQQTSRKEELLGVLTDEQRAAYDRLFGKPFEFPL